MKLDVTFWTKKGMSPEAFKGRKGKGKVGVQNKNTQHIPMRCIIRLAAVSCTVEAFPHYFLVCGTLVSHHKSLILFIRE